MNIWKYYRYDFDSSSGQDNRPPTNSFEWVGGEWKRRAIADALLDVTDAQSSVYFQIDTVSTINGDNASSSCDLNFLTSAIPDASTNTMGGKFDSSTRTSITVNSFGDGLIKSTNIISTSVYGDTFSSLRFRYDNNTTRVGYCSIYVSFATPT